MKTTEIYYATTNTGKIATLQRELSPYSIQVVQVPLDIPEPRSSDVQEIARLKIKYAYDHLHKPVAALDAGFYIHSLNGFPRAFVNFALETIGLEGILRLVGTNSEKERLCEFRECLAYVDDEKEAHYFVATIPGKISIGLRGEMQPHLWSELGRIFIPRGLDKTLAEMTEQEYANWRHHRPDTSSASKMFARWIGEQNKKEKQ